MALMTYREPNQVKWQGTRPGHDGTQFAIKALPITGTVVMHTVLAGTVYYLCSVSVGVFVAAVGQVWFSLDLGGVDQYICGPIVVMTLDGAIPALSTCFNPPLECTVGWKLYASATGVGLTGAVSAFGWYE